MKARKWSFRQCRYYTTTIDDRCFSAIAEIDIKQKGICPNCGKEFEVRSGYGSLVYFMKNMNIPYYVCEDCQLLEEEQKEK